jgi:Abnormal spindle-like microcephaly-assoc'd, ASPM-SPD-2-Hydin
LANSGTGSLTISQAAVSGSGFTTSGLVLPLTLIPGQRSNFTLAFAPAAAGSVTGSVSLINNAPNSPTIIALSGTGVVATVQVTASPTSLSYGNVNVGSSSSKTVTLTNTGNASVNVSSDSVSGAGFSISGLAPLTLGAGQSTTFSVNFAPAATGSVSGSVSVASNATNSPTLIALTGSGVQPSGPAGPLAAFPGAQGGGALSVGGRGGVVYEVTNLNDSGSGSLRACVEGSGPRTCVFRTGGTIVLSSTLHVLNPFLTIAGQTAPGAGIQITNSASCNVSNNCDLLRVGTHDVIVRYLRARLSPASGTNYSSPMSILNEPVSVHNVIFDHCSNAWGEWDNWDIYSDSSNIIYDTTLQWSILAEPVYTTNGSVNAVISGSTSATSNGFHDVDMHHNFLTGANHRNPSDRISQSRIVNNLIYNTSYYDIKVMGASDVINNYIKAGPYGGSRTEIQTTTAVSIGTTVTPSLYIVGNAANSNSFNGAADQWTGTLTGLAPGEDNSDTVSTPLSTTYQRTTPLAVVGAAITVDPAANLASSTGVLLPVYPNSSGNPGVGASIKLNDSACDGTFLANRDTQDATYVTQFNNNTGHSGNITGPGTLPTLAAGTPCTSSLHDGIADQWKINYGLSLTDTGLSARTAPNGYTYLENYLNGTNPNLTASTSSTTSLWAASLSTKLMGGRLKRWTPAVSKGTATIQRRETFLSSSSADLLIH